MALGGATRLSSLRDRRDYQPSWRWRIRWHAAIAVSSELLARQILVGRLDLAVIHAIPPRLEVRPMCGQPRRGGTTRVMHADMEAEVGSRRLAATPRSGTCCATSVVRRLCSTGREQQIIVTQSQGFDPSGKNPGVPVRSLESTPPHRWNPSPTAPAIMPECVSGPQSSEGTRSDGSDAKRRFDTGGVGNRPLKRLTSVVMGLEARFSAARAERRRRRRARHRWLLVV